MKISIYVHWPFCQSKCPYCDFNSHVSNSIDYKQWEEAYIREIDYFKEYLQDKEIISIFFGGGTPSLMPEFLVESIINKFNLQYTLSKDAEITLEANPTSVETEKFKNFAAIGVNRISIGVQSFNEDDLKFLGRNHNKNDAIKAIEIARNNFNDYSFDLIYARPNQNLDSWEKELNYALKFVGGHISLYQLTIEKGTPFYKSYKDSQFQLPNQEIAADLYDLTNKIMIEHNMPAYEISNYAMAGKESRHNLNYWQYGSYLGIGPGAHSRINQSAIMMIHNPNNWINQVLNKNHGIQIAKELKSQDILEEILITGLRLKKGIKIQYLELKTGKSFCDLIAKEKIDFLIDNKLVELNDHLSLTDKGSLILNQIIRKLIL